MTPLSQRLREATRTLHARAERAGPMPALLRGTLPRAGYVAMLAQLVPVYAALEQGLGRPGAPAIDPRLHRLAALRADLAALGGAEVAVTEAATRFGQAIAALPPPRLAAHAWVRYGGDLAGGQVLRRIVGRAYGLSDEGLHFYAFDGAPAELLAGLRAALDALPAAEGDAVAAEACTAFERHVELFEALPAV
jgi:heme oxygenase